MLRRFLSGPFLEHVGRNMRSSLYCSSTIFRTNQLTQRGDYGLIAMAHDFKLSYMFPVEPKLGGYCKPWGAFVLGETALMQDTRG